MSGIYDKYRFNMVIFRERGDYVDTKLKDLVVKLKQKSKYFNIYIWGAGNYGELLGGFLNNQEIGWSGYIDNNTEIQNSYKCGKKIYGLDSVDNVEKIYVLISLSPLLHKNTVKSIYEQLNSKHIDNNNIIYIGEHVEIMDSIVRYMGNARKILKRNSAFKDMYTNRRCFIIGNGPSLQLEDLEHLHNEVTMGCNGLIKVLAYTKWRPTCFFFEDSIFVQENIKNESELEHVLSSCEYGFTSFRRNLYTKYGTKYDNMYYLYVGGKKEEMQFSDDICKEVYTAGTTLYTMMQVAVYMGIREIYLLGVDFSFGKVIDSEGKITINPGIKNHMKLMDEVTQGVYTTDLILEGYKFAKEYAERHGIKIYNATRGGKLEVFERVNFDELF